MAVSYNSTGPVFIFRNEKGYKELEKRQLFLRSYHFSRKQSLTEKIKKSLFRVKRVIWGRFRSARKLKKMLWFKLRHGLFFTCSRRRRCFLRLHKYNTYATSRLDGPSSQSYCFW